MKIIILIVAAVVAAFALGTYNNYVHADLVAADATMLEPAGN